VSKGGYRLTEGEPRFRVAVKQTAKNLWQLDATIEHNSRTIEVPLSTEDVANTESRELGVELLNMIKETEKVFREDKRNLVSDIE